MYGIRRGGGERNEKGKLEDKRKGCGKVEGGGMVGSDGMTGRRPDHSVVASAAKQSRDPPHPVRFHCPEMLRCARKDGSVRDRTNC